VGDDGASYTLAAHPTDEGARLWGKKVRTADCTQRTSQGPRSTPKTSPSARARIIFTHLRTRFAQTYTHRHTHTHTQQVEGWLNLLSDLAHNFAVKEPCLHTPRENTHRLLAL
jgi:hypothetical protein